MAWDYYRDGVSIGGVKILERLNSEQSKWKVLYRVRYDCCGEQDELSHAQIHERIRRDSASCKACQRRGQGIARRQELLVATGSCIVIGRYLYPFLGKMGPRNGWHGHAPRMDHLK